VKILHVIPLALALVVPAIAHPDPSHSLAEIERHLTETPNDPQLLFQKAEILLKGRRPELARPVADEALRFSPDDPPLLVLRARIAVAVGEREDAMRRAEEMLQRFPEFPSAYAFAAALYHQAGKLDQAIKAKQRQLTIDPSDPGDYLALAMWLEERNGAEDRDAAIQFLDQAIARSGAVLALQQRAVKLECDLRRFDSALRRVDTLVAKFLPSAAFSLMRADIHEAAGRYQDAAHACDSAIALLDLEASAGGEPSALRQSIVQRRAENLAK